jgi:FMN phosphatase YigB (HAD superfamily)
MRVKIILDFDDVIFNTGKFLEDYKKILIRCGVPTTQLDYPRSKNRQGKTETYNLKRHISFIRTHSSCSQNLVFSLGPKRGKNSRINIKELEKNIAEFIKENRKYLFRDVVRFLEKFPKGQFYLLSYANDKKWQRNKIKNSGIGQYFKKIIICSGLKSEGICQILRKEDIIKAENTFFIDDRVEHLEDIKKCHPKIFTILLKRKEGRFREKRNGYCDFEAKNLKEAAKIIENLCEANRQAKVTKGGEGEKYVRNSRIYRKK